YSAELLRYTDMIENLGKRIGGAGERRKPFLKGFLLSPAIYFKRKKLLTIALKTWEHFYTVGYESKMLS
ncbi:MAG: hypothetical protein JXQ83_05415, partial [Candidatus Glassbacteria bacterium]|nr:hypothetical protein [Candidatus Glassbacteria bacterium]